MFFLDLCDAILSKNLVNLTEYLANQDAIFILFSRNQFDIKMESLLVEHLPQVLVNIVVEYARIKPIRFTAFKKDQKEFSITEDGTRISCVTNDNRHSSLVGFVSEEPFYMSHKTWTVDVSHAPNGGFWIGIANLLHLDKTNAFDVPNESCCCISKWGTVICWSNLSHIPPISIDTRITFTADMETKTIKIILNGQEPISWDAYDLEHCRPYICFDTHYSNLSIDVQSQ